jgi:hypothetical protein
VTVLPPDAVVAARSFPRRWRALFARAEGIDEDGDLLERSGALALASEAASVLLDAAVRIGGRSLTAVEADPLDRLEHTADALADAIGSVPPDDWADGRLHSLSEGIDRAAALLRRADQAIDEARHHRSA